MSRRRGRRLSEDDLDTWRAVARTAQPLRPEIRATPEAPAPDRPAGRSPEPSTALPAFRIGETARNGPPGHDLARPLGHRLSAQPLRMDAKAFGRLKRGKLTPERKIDLHGMTLAAAHPALTRFILAAHRDRLRLVLVVTGKGRSGGDEGGPIPAPRGLLRHHVPGWLHQAPLRQVVLQVTDAHVRHGGSGAYYVYLARPRQ